MVRLKYALTEEKGERDMSDSKRRLWTIPNVLTLIRLILVPVYWVLMLGYHLDYWALGAFLLASATDMLDGFLARRMQCITDFGKLMDPLADKVMVVTALLCQTITGNFPVVAFIIVMLKELMMIFGGAFMLKRDIVVYSNMLGKTAQVAFIAALVLCFWHRELAAVNVPVDVWVLWIAVALALAAMIDYAIGAVKKLKQAKKL